MVATVYFSGIRQNGSYTMAAKPIKSLELHYTMIQFLIIEVICVIIFLTTRLSFASQEFVPNNTYTKFAISESLKYMLRD